MFSYQWTSAILGTLLGLSILYLVRRNHLHSRYAMWWLPVGVTIALLGIFPRFTDSIAAFLGINYPPVLVLVIGLGLTLIKILMMDIERSRNEAKLQRLIQRVAIIEATGDKEVQPPPEE